MGFYKSKKIMSHKLSCLYNWHFDNFSQEKLKSRSFYWRLLSECSFQLPRHCMYTALQSWLLCNKFTTCYRLCMGFKKYSLRKFLAYRMLVRKYYESTLKKKGEGWPLKHFDSILKRKRKRNCLIKIVLKNFTNHREMSNIF